MVLLRFVETRLLENWKMRFRNACYSILDFQRFSHVFPQLECSMETGKLFSFPKMCLNVLKE